MMDVEERSGEEFKEYAEEGIDAYEKIGKRYQEYQRGIEKNQQNDRTDK